MARPRRCNSLVTLLARSSLPVAAYGTRGRPAARNRSAFILAGWRMLVWLAALYNRPPNVLDRRSHAAAGAAILRRTSWRSSPALVSIKAALADSLGGGRSALKGWACIAAGLLVGHANPRYRFRARSPSRLRNGAALLVTLVVAITGIVASLPIGILLALGRRSQNARRQDVLDRLHRDLARRSADHRALPWRASCCRCSCPTGMNFDKLAAGA